MQWLLYGATGYSGLLIAEEAVARGLKPCLGGRDEAKVSQLAKRLGLPWRTFSLDSPTAVKEGLKGMHLVLNAAGPFSQTADAFIRGCIEEKVHYLDITGEVAVFELAFKKSEAAAKAGILLLPGVGFDVVPSDCLAARLAESLPDADSLELAFCSVGKPSPGTLKTMVEAMGSGCWVRRDGHLVEVPAASLQMKVPFSDVTRSVTAIPWGDVSTAFRSTGIENITTYTVMPKPMQWVSRLLSVVSPLAKSRGFQSWLKKRVEKNIPGPTAEERKAGKVYLWGRVRNSAGKMRMATLETPDGYAFTVDSAVSCVQRLLVNVPRKGMATPSQVFGPRFVDSLAGVSPPIFS